jgi:hypothetical protein
MSSEKHSNFKLDQQNNVIEICELIKVTLDLSGLIQRRFRMYRYHRQAQVIGDIRRLLAQVFEIDLFPDDTFAKFLAGAFEDGSEDEVLK